MTNEQQKEFESFLKELKAVGKQQKELMKSLKGSEFEEGE